jgi:hypothetical protein
VKKKKMIAKGLTSKSRAATVRATISFPHKLHTTLEKIAKQKTSPLNGRGSANRRDGRSRSIRTFIRGAREK